VTCSEFMAFLDDLLDEKVSAELRADLDEHVRGCEHCLITMNTTRKTIEIYRSHDIYELPDTLRERLQQAILTKCRKC
jgi:5S rRNA maturation endonuclease (ribonuclease M5)